MKQRITYLRHTPADGFTPAQLRVEHDGALHVRGLRALKEHRVTLGARELPAKIQAVLEQCQALHLRWASSAPYVAGGPFAARAPPGLHVFYAPRSRDETGDVLCPVLKELFHEDMKCFSPQLSFSPLPEVSTRSSGAAAQFHALVPSLAQLAMYLQQDVCRSSDQQCQAQAFELLSASALDVDYDASSDELVLKVVWDGHAQSEGWNEKIAKRPGGQEESIEVGVLNSEKPDEPEELKLGGWLTIIGEDDKPKPTLFSFPSRHHPMPAAQSSLTYHTTFSQPTGLHPTLLLHFNSTSLASPLPSCALHAYLTLPSPLFLDRYQFTDPLFLASQNLAALSSLTGATDLEAPDWALPTWGSAALFSLAPPTAAPHTIKLPLHARYLAPRPGGTANVSTPWPAVFWACDAPADTKFPVSPFDRTHLGFDALFAADTLFFHVPPARGGGEHGDLLATMAVPVLDLERAGSVESGTVAAVVLGVAWVLWQLFRPVGGRRGGGVAGKGKGR